MISTFYKILNSIFNYISFDFYLPIQNPEWMKNLLIRLDYFMTSLSTHTDLYKFTDHIDVELNTLSEKLQLTASLNGKHITIPNVPLWINRNLDAKFDRPEQIALSFGYTRKSQIYFILGIKIEVL